MSGYTVIERDLATARPTPGEPLLLIGAAYDAVNIRALPAGNSVFLVFGRNRDPVPVFLGDTISFKDECDRPEPQRDGLFLINPAGAGTLVLLVSSGGVGVNAP